MSPDTTRPRISSKWIGPLAILALLSLALIALRGEVSSITYRQVVHAIRRIGGTEVALATLCTAAAYALMSGYDLLALRYARVQIGIGRAMFASMVAYGLSQTLGFPLLTGGAVRVRLWSGWGVSAPQIARATTFISLTFVVGILSMVGAGLLIEPDATLHLLHIGATTARIVGGGCLALVFSYVLWAWRPRRRRLRVHKWLITVPRPSVAIAQILLAVCDWSVAAAVLWVLLPRDAAVSPIAFVGVFVLSQTAGLLSQVPGGVGVFESCMMLALSSAMPTERAFAALIVYRGVYYLLPLAAASAALAASEVARTRRQGVARVGDSYAEQYATVLGRAKGIAMSARRGGAALQTLLPTALGISTFAGGAMLLFSGATPAVQGRMRLLQSMLPLGIVELSHFTASMAGVGLLVLGYALHRRLDAAWGLTLAVLGVAVIASLAKGLDYEEATLLTGVILILLPSRDVFYRKATLTTEPLSPEWVVAVVAVVGASIWLGLFAYQHVEYSGELWWRFAARANAPRFLRASTGAVTAIIGLGLWRLLRSATADAAAPTPEQVAQAARIVAATADSTPALALLGDKSLLFSESGDAFLMYGVSGKSWVALGDPTGPADGATELAWRFKDEADQHGAWPVFYEVSSAMLPLYIDLGLSLLKLGEEAIVPLTEFSIDAPSSKWMRRAVRDADKAGMLFEVVTAGDVPPLLPALKAISDEWLSGKSTREKGFSMGRFDEEYLTRFPMALVRVRRDDGSCPIVAFANVWCGAAGGEVSPDLMRSSAGAPRGVMDFLFIQLLLWGKAQGYTRANLGMAPLSGLQDRRRPRRRAPLWNRAGAFVYGRGEYFYNFQGLRTFKSKFSPRWEPRYLASPSGLVLPRVLTNVATLIAGGMTDLVRK